jgi:hypothetical protein
MAIDARLPALEGTASAEADLPRMRGRFGKDPKDKDQPPEPLMDDCLDSANSAFHRLRQVETLVRDSLEEPQK